MRQYLALAQNILDHGTFKGDRTGTGTKSLFGYQMRFDLYEGFPLVTTKKIYWKAVVHELLWFLSGDTNIQYLTDNGVKIWNEWATPTGELGPVYGAMWRNWETHNGNSIDQIADLITEIKCNPNSRRLVVSAWNPALLPDPKLKPYENAALGKQALPPCHTLFQFNVADGKLSCQMYQRSADVGLGVPFNIASYALLTHMIAHVCGLEVGEFVHTLGDVHIYTNHIDTMRSQLERSPFQLPTLTLNPDVTNIFDFTYDDIILENYQHHSPIKMEISV